MKELDSHLDIFNPHPSRCIGPHPDAILICYELPPRSASSQASAILNKALLTALLQFVGYADDLDLS